MQNVTENFKRVLCVCSCNELRSPTIAWVLSNAPWNYNTRSCGTDKFYSVISVSKPLLQWAEEIVCADEKHEKYIRYRLRDLKVSPKIICLGIPDLYEYRDETLISLIKDRYEQKSKSKVI